MTRYTRLLHDVLHLTQFIAVWSSSILAETLGYAASFSSPWRGKRRVFERRKPVLIDQLQPSTNSDTLSERPWPAQSAALPPLRPHGRTRPAPVSNAPAFVAPPPAGVR